uniref:Reverse transcriptase domain-containing protein n=1 Tax=Tanacetum cinerariifolium TaxID=118510 RepID=A0A6L2N0I2_TANCI|nr:reverse transcriptase domain-containing protein [Tanacetum cinerariifolium]
MSNSEGSANKGEMKESSKKLKRKIKTMKGYEGDERIMFEFILRGFTKKDVKLKQIILDLDDLPMWESAKTVAPTPSFIIVRPDVDKNFIINSTHFNMIRENKFDGYLRADPHDHIREFLAICNMFIYGETQSEASLNEEMQEMRKNYNNYEGDHASKNHQNDGMPMCERHEANYIQFGELNYDVKNDLEDFKRRIRSMRTIHWKLFAKDDGKTTGVLTKKKSKTVNQEPQSKIDFEKSITKFLDGQRVTNMFFKNNVNDMIIKMKQNKKNFQTKIKNMKRKIDEWSKSKNISLEKTDRTDHPPQAHNEHVNAIFTRSEKSDDSLKILKDPPPPIIVNNKIKKDKPIKTSKKGYQVVKTNEYPLREYIPKTPYPQRLNVDHSYLNRIVKHLLLVLRSPKYPKSKKNMPDEEEVLYQP